MSFHSPSVTPMDRIDIWPGSREPDEADFSTFVWEGASPRQSTSKPPDTTTRSPSSSPFPQQFIWHSQAEPQTPPSTLVTPHNPSHNHFIDTNALFYQSQGTTGPRPHSSLPGISSLLPATSSQLAMMDVRHAASLSLPTTNPRRPSKENEIAASPFRPHVAATQRLLFWTFADTHVPRFAIILY